MEALRCLATWTDARVGYGDRKAVAAALRPIYTAPTVEAADRAGYLRRIDLGHQVPGHRAGVWRDAGERFIPFLEFPPEVRKISSESLNYQLRKIIKNRGHFPSRRCRGSAPTWTSRWRGESVTRSV